MTHFEGTPFAGMLNHHIQPLLERLRQEGAMFASTFRLLAGLLVTPSEAAKVYGLSTDRPCKTRMEKIDAGRRYASRVIEAELRGLIQYRRRGGRTVVVPASPDPGPRPTLPEGDEIVFRRLDRPVVWRWVAEYWRCEVLHPIGQAWVSTAYSGYVEWLHVMEPYRREGVGTALLGAIRARWPGIGFCAATEAGERFLASIDADDEASGGNTVTQEETRR